MPSPVDADRLAYSYINLSTLAISALHSEPSPLRLWRRPDGLLHRASRDRMIVPSGVVRERRAPDVC